MLLHFSVHLPYYNLIKYSTKGTCKSKMINMGSIFLMSVLYIQQFSLKKKIYKNIVFKYRLNQLLTFACSSSMISLNWL